ncbi:MAG: hypothetical protein V4658_08960 [Bacteroidota bacterium]
MGKKFSIERTGIIGVVSFILALLAYNPVNAQTEYDESDYSDYTESAYSTENPYQKYNYSYKRKQEERYKKTSREEDLYNGRYQNHQESHSYWSSGGVGNLGGKKSGTGHQPGGRNTDRSLKDPFTVVQERDRNTDADPANDKPVNLDNPGKSTGIGEGNNEGPPPPPDEPDVPVDTAIPFLIVAGIGLAGFKFYIQKRASVN